MRHLPSKTPGLAAAATAIPAVLLCILPFFASVVPPMTDVSQHVLVARVLAAYDDPVLRFSDYFDIEWTATPTALFYVVLAGLQRLTGPFWDARVYLSCWVGLLWLSVWFLARVHGHRHPWIPALAVLPLAFCWYVYMGLLPFLMTFPLFAATLAVWLCGLRAPVRMVLVWGLLVLLFGFHLVGVAGAAAAIAVTSAVRYLLRKVERAELAWAAGSLAPVPLLLVPYLVGRNAPATSLQYAGLLENALDVVKFTCSTLDSGAALLMLVWLLSLGVLFATSWPKVRRRPALIAAAAALVLLSVLLPSNLGALWPAGPRLLPYALILLVVWLPWPESRRVIVAGALLALIAGLSLATIRHARELDRDLRDFLAGVELVEPGRRLLPVLVNPSEGSRWVDPYWSLGSAYTVFRGGVNPYVFAIPYIKTGASPLRYRDRTQLGYAFLYDEPHQAQDYRGVSCCYDYVLLFGDAPELESVLRAELSVLSRHGRTILFAQPQLVSHIEREPSRP